MTCDSQTNDVFADGQSISMTGEFSEDYNVPDNLIIPRGSDVIAIKCTKVRSRKEVI